MGKARVKSDPAHRGQWCCALLEQLTDLNSLLVSKFDLAQVKLTKNNAIQQFVKGVRTGTPRCPRL